MLPYPSFSSAEMLRRRELVAAVLSEAEVEHLVVYGANRAGSGVQWLTRWPVTREAVVVHTPGEVDTLLVQFFNHVPNARRMALDAEVRWAGPRTVTTVVEELRARGAGSDARLGVVGALPFQAFQALAEAVGSVFDLNAAYTRLRMIKSPEELEWLRRAAELTDLSCAALRDGAAPGRTEHDLAAIVEGSYLARGGSNYIHYFSVTAMDLSLIHI